MKPKNLFKFVLLGATALTLVACGETEEDVLAYDSVDACVKAGQQDEAVCRAEFANAQKLHNEVAPRYDSAQESKLDFGSAFHSLSPTLQVVIAAAFRIPATSEHVASPTPAATSSASMRSDTRGMGRRTRR